MLSCRNFYYITALLSLLLTASLHAQKLDKWPREVKVSTGSITIYQPQVESLENNILKGKAAVAYNGQGT
jgi:hypothetical protein